jgi:hypothetical protein
MYVNSNNIHLRNIRPPHHKIFMTDIDHLSPENFQNGNVILLMDGCKFLPIRFRDSCAILSFDLKECFVDVLAFIFSVPISGVSLVHPPTSWTCDFNHLRHPVLWVVLATLILLLSLLVLKQAIPSSNSSLSLHAPSSHEQSSPLPTDCIIYSLLGPQLHASWIQIPEGKIRDESIAGTARRTVYLLYWHQECPHFRLPRAANLVPWLLQKDSKSDRILNYLSKLWTRKSFPLSNSWSQQDQERKWIHKVRTVTVNGTDNRTVFVSRQHQGYLAFWIVCGVQRAICYSFHSSHSQLSFEIVNSKIFSVYPMVDHFTY